MKKAFTFLALTILMAGGFAGEPVKASGFGFNSGDATPCLQKAIDSGAEKILVDNTGSDWIVDAITLRSNQEIIIGSGVRVVAMKDKFKETDDCLFSATDVRNVTIRGEKGAVIAMRKTDYQDASRYKPAEHRHTFRLRNCDNVTIRDLEVRSSGGDGVYIAGNQNRNHSSNILLENLILDDHHRQGISVISVKGLVIRGCTISNTKGTAPMCGIDFEPNNRDEFLQDILVEDCRFSNNNGDIIMATKLRTPCSVTIRNCHMSGSNTGIITGVFLNPKDDPDRAPPGFFTVENCVIENTRKTAMLFRDHRADMFALTLKNITIRNPGKTAIQFWAEFSVSLRTGSAKLDNIVIEDRENPDFMFFDTKKLPGAVLTDVTGTVIFNGKKIDVAQWIAKQGWNRGERLSDRKLDDPQRLVPLGGEPGPTAPKPLRLRHDFRYLFACRKGVPVAFELELIPIGDTSRTLDNLALTAPDGSRQWLEPVTTGGKLRHRFVPRMDGVYVLDVDTRSMVMVLEPLENCVWSVTPLPEKRSGALYLQFFTANRESRIYFRVPAGLEEFKFNAFGNLTAVVEDPAGNEVLEVNAPGQDTVYTVKRKSGQDEIWSFLLKNAPGTTGIRLTEPLRPIFASEKRNLLIQP